MLHTQFKKHKFAGWMVIVSCLLASCSETHEPINLASESGHEKLKFGKVNRKNISSTIQLPGELRPFQEVKIFPKINGFVKEVLVDRGSVVHRGQMLITLEAPETEQQLQSAKAKYIQSQELSQASKDKYNRILEASKTQGTVSPADLESAKSKMNGDEALMNAEKSNVEALKTLTGYLTITAPFDGIISERNVHPGALVGPNAKMEMPLLMLEQEQKLRLVVYVPEAFTGNVDCKRKVVFKTASFPGKQFEGTICRSAGVLNTGMRAEAVEIDVDAGNHILKPGMYAEVITPLISGTESFNVPTSSIITSTERKYIIALQNGKAKFIDIQEGIKTEDSTEVFGSITENQSILLNGNNGIKENQLINEGDINIQK
jgi:membrane fusion protein (multidrug efflux system)